MTATSTSPFWTFSLRFYRLEGVAPACLEMQDLKGVDVNVLLFLLFLGHNGRAVLQADVAEIDAAVAGWRAEAVVPLRAVRRFLRAPPPTVDAAAAGALRERIKAVELEAERLQQEALFALRPVADWGRGGGATAPSDNLAAYGAHLRTILPAAAVNLLLERLAGLPVAS